MFFYFYLEYKRIQRVEDNQKKLDVIYYKGDFKSNCLITFCIESSTVILEFISMLQQ